MKIVQLNNSIELFNIFIRFPLNLRALQWKTQLNFTHTFLFICIWKPNGDQKSKYCLQPPGDLFTTRKILFSIFVLSVVKVHNATHDCL